ncbi:MAG: phosphatidylglycerophosphatase A [Candidatus Omnitrophica bacterium]|nr:phosphatidylglycerophosphatase A [Candidatus Omnitrophota bacterium]
MTQFRMSDKAMIKISTLFGAGDLPFCPGTWGSVPGVLLVIFLHKHLVLYVLAFVIFFLVGLLVSGQTSTILNESDPPRVVIDEFACVFPVYFYIPLNIKAVIIGFIIYRVLDILKPPPARQIESLPGGIGIMLDDLIVAIYSNILLRFLVALRLI